MNGRHRVALERDLTIVVTALAEDRPLASRRRDHALIGATSGIATSGPIYRKPDSGNLQLVHLGSHSELGL